MIPGYSSLGYISRIYGNILEREGTAREIGELWVGIMVKDNHPELVDVSEKQMAQKEYKTRKCTMCGKRKYKNEFLSTTSGFIYGICKACNRGHTPLITPRQKHIPTKPPQIPNIRWSSTCSMLKQHAEILKEDPDKLSTEFIKKIIGLKENDCADDGEASS